jgi:hypothetical protein
VGNDAQSAGKTRLRSAVSAGNRHFVAEGDGRSVWARRQRDIAQMHVADLGGQDILSEAQLSLCRRTATLEVTLEQLEAAMSEGKDVDLDQYGRLYGHLRRGLETLGLQRVSRDVTPTLEAVVAEIHAKKARNDQTD